MHPEMQGFLPTPTDRAEKYLIGGTDDTLRRLSLNTSFPHFGFPDLSQSSEACNVVCLCHSSLCGFLSEELLLSKPHLIRCNNAITPEPRKRDNWTMVSARLWYQIAASGHRAVRMMSMSNHENSSSTRFRCILSSIVGVLWGPLWQQNRCWLWR